MQAMLKAIEASDGSPRERHRADVKVQVPKEESLLGEAYSFDENGDTTLKDMSVFKVSGTDIRSRRRSRSTRRCSRPDRGERGST